MHTIKKCFQIKLRTVGTEYFTFSEIDRDMLAVTCFSYKTMYSE